MTKSTLLKTALVLLAGVGTALPQQVVAGENTAKAEQPKASILDVKLDQKGALSGYVVNEQGKPQADQKVTIKQGRSIVADVNTDAKGHFEAKDLKGGVYQIESAKGTTSYRVWSEKSAPKSSKEFAVVVAGKQQIVRAQGDMLDGSGLGTAATVGLAGVGAGFGIAAYDESKDNGKKLDQIINSP